VKRLGALLCAGLLLAGCSSISAASAMVNWVKQSGYVANTKTLLGDARNSLSIVRNLGASDAERHTVCAVLLVDAEAANSALPSPDAQVTTLLSKAYDSFGAGANHCYDAGTNPVQLADAVKALTSGASLLAEASARIATVSTP